MRVEKGKVVAITYILRTNGVMRQVRTGAWGDLPFEYVHGSGAIIPGLEKALEGKQPGDNFTVTIPPEEAYGPRDRALQQKVPRALLAELGDLEEGMLLEGETEDGKRDVVMVTEIDEQEQTVTLDANRPLAGMTLEFQVHVVDVRDATKDERTRGTMIPLFLDPRDRRRRAGAGEEH